MPRILRDNSLSLVMLAIFLVSLIGQALTGWHVNNEDLREHGRPEEGLGAYLHSGHFGEAVFENWESEFLQMGSFVWLSAFLYQKGASESKDPEGGPEDVDRDPRQFRDKPDAPWPVRHGGLPLRIYEWSLSLSLFGLFAISFVLHGLTGHAAHNAERPEHGEAAISLGSFMAGAQFWFESLQNWQSEFLSVVVLAVLSIFLRHRGSSQSKPVDAAHSETTG